MEYSFRKIWIITLSMLISLVMQDLIGLTDTAFLGRVGDGEMELGASALGSIYYLVIYMIGFGFSIGAEILMARRNGEKEYDKIGPIFVQGIIFLLILAAVMCVSSLYFSDAILG